MSIWPSLTHYLYILRSRLLFLCQWPWCKSPSTYCPEGPGLSLNGQHISFHNIIIMVFNDFISVSLLVV